MNAEPSFGQVVKSRRRELGLTQDELARRVGCAPVTLRKIEYDDLRPSIQIAERLAMALNLPLEERSAFVRLARLMRVSEPAISTPAPRREEIGLEDLSGRAVRGYALAERIGQGGMGAVYRAVQPIVEREVAVKIILPQFADHPDFIRRFEAEAQLIARLEHPHIVPLYDYWREPGVAYLVMRLLRGGSVKTLLEGGPLALAVASRIVEQVAGALAAAHRAGVVHRDLKPGNILLDEDGNAYLADFGIAKNLSNPSLEGVTQADAIVGSPPYISPEQIRSEFVRPQTDIYCLGVVLYELLTGALPFTGPTPVDVFHQHLTAPLPPLAAHRAGLPGALDAVIGRATAKDPAQRYPTVDDLLADWHQALAGQGLAGEISSAALAPAPARALTEADNPYKGLRAFTEADADDFFGREALIHQLLIRLGEGGDLARFLAVVGPSGSGKSSVVKAGLIPALRRGGLPGSDHWFIVELAPGAHPYEALEAALLRVAVSPPASLVAQLQDGARGLLRAVERCLPPDENVQLVLVLDQFEEIFTLVEAEAERASLLASLVAAVLDERSRVRVVITLRADFTDRPLRYVDFGEFLRQRSEFVLPLTPDELERAIVGPAERAGLTVEPGLEAALIRDVDDQPGALPLLQYTLTELFERRGGATLTRQAYSDLGGITGALAYRAEAAFAGLDPRSQAAVRQLCLRLVTLGEGIEDTCRRVLRSELETLTPYPYPKGGGESAPSPLRGEGRGEGNMRPVLDAFGRARLLSFDRDPATRAPTVEVAHEALLREWPRLRGWLDESRGDIRMQRTLAFSAAEWEAANRDPSYLLTGARLAQFEGWISAATVALTPAERAYYAASVAEHDRLETEEAERRQRELETAQRLAETEKRRAEEQTLSATRLRRRAVYLVLALGAALVLLVAALGLAQLSNQSRAKAEQQAALASARELDSAAELQVSADPQLSLLLSLQAISTTRAAGLGMPWDVQQTLHDILPAQRLLWSQKVPYLAAKIAYSRDGKRLTVVDGTTTASKTYILDADTRQILLTFKGWGFAYSPDEKLLATGECCVQGLDSYPVYLWDAVTGQQLVTMTGHTDLVSAFAFSPDGNMLVSGGDEGVARVWDLRPWRALGEPAGTTITQSLYVLDCYRLAAYYGGINFSLDGNHLVTVCDKDSSARVWDMTSGKQIFRLADDTDWITDADFSPDGRRLATISGDGSARLWDTITGKELLTLSVGKNLYQNVAFSPDGRQLVTTIGPNAVVWDPEIGTRLFALPNPGTLWGLAFSSDGKRLITTMNGLIQAWDITPLGPGELAIADRSPASWFNPWFPDFSHSPDGSLFAVKGDGFLSAYDSTTLRELWSLGLYLGTATGGMSFSADNTLLAAGAYHQITILQAASGNELFTLNAPELVARVTLSPDGTRVAAGMDADHGDVVIWDLAARQPVITLTNPLGSILSIAFSPDGTHLAAAGSVDRQYLAGGGRALVWDLSGGAGHIPAPVDLRFDTRAIHHVAFSPDGQDLAVAGDGGAIVWHWATGQAVITLTGHTESIWNINYSPDGKYLVTASADTTAKVWDAKTGAELLSYQGPSHAVQAFFAPLGKGVVVGSGIVGWSFRRYAFLNFDDVLAAAYPRLLRDWQPGECLKYLHNQTCPGRP